MPPTRNTFAKPRPPAPVAGPPGGARAALGPFGNPVIGSVTAAGFFIACAAALVALTGNPKAGAPVVRLSLARIADTSAPPGWRDALAERASRRRALRRRHRGSSPPAAARRSGRSETARPSSPSPTTPSSTAARAAAGGGLPQAPIAGLFVQGPGGPLPVIGAGRQDAGPGLRPALRRRRQAARRPDHRRPRPQRQGDPRGDRQPAAGDHPLVRALFRGPAGLDRHGPRRRPRGAARSADGAEGLSRTTTPAPTP